MREHEQLIAIQLEDNSTRNFTLWDIQDVWPVGSDRNRGSRFYQEIVHIEDHFSVTCSSYSYINEHEKINTTWNVADSSFEYERPEDTEEDQLSTIETEYTTHITNGFQPLNAELLRQGCNSGFPCGNVEPLQLEVHFPVVPPWFITFNNQQNFSYQMELSTGALLNVDQQEVPGVHQIMIEPDPERMVLRYSVGLGEVQPITRELSCGTHRIPVPIQQNLGDELLPTQNTPRIIRYSTSLIPEDIRDHYDHSLMDYGFYPPNAQQSTENPMYWMHSDGCHIEVTVKTDDLLLESNYLVEVTTGYWFGSAGGTGGNGPSTAPSLSATDSTADSKCPQPPDAERYIRTIYDTPPPNYRAVSELSVPPMLNANGEWFALQVSEWDSGGEEIPPRNYIVLYQNGTEVCKTTWQTYADCRSPVRTLQRTE
jgi:hypothetical protein